MVSWAAASIAEWPIQAKLGYRLSHSVVRLRKVSSGLQKSMSVLPIHRNSKHTSTWIFRWIIYITYPRRTSAMKQHWGLTCSRLNSSVRISWSVFMLSSILHCVFVCVWHSLSTLYRFNLYAIVHSTSCNVSCTVHRFVIKLGLEFELLANWFWSWFYI